MSNLANFALSMLAYQEGRKPSKLRKLMFCGLGVHRSNEYKSDRNIYEYCHDCGKTEQTRSAPIMAALRQRPTPLTDDYILHLINVYDNDSDRRKMDMYWIKTVVAMDVLGAKSVEEWDDRFGEDSRSEGYKKARARIARILFQDGKLTQQIATEIGAFD